jgi:nicotinamidase-related amidase
VSLVRNAETLGIHHYILPQDNHPPGSLEFHIYPEHCVEGSWESKTVDELQELPNAYKFKVFPKQSINPGMEPALLEWLDQNPGVRQFVVVGDCTDICVHQIAMFLKIRSVARNAPCSVIVPVDCVDTYDLAQEGDPRKGPPPHPGDLMHCLFLYHMHLNGIRVVAGLK